MYEAFNIAQHYGLGDSPRMVRHFGAIEWRFSVDRASYIAFVSSPESAYTDYARRGRNSHPLVSKLKNIYFARFRGFGTVDDAIQCMQLPSLRELKATDILALEQVITFTLPMYTCPLKKLDLILNVLSPIALAGLLKRVKGIILTCFRPLFTSSRIDSQAKLRILRWPRLHKSTAPVFTALPTQTTIRGGKSRHFWLDKDIPAVGRGLKQFENLERLKVSDEILVVEGWWISDEDRYNELLAKSGDAEDAYITGVYFPPLLAKRLSTFVCRWYCAKFYKQAYGFCIFRLKIYHSR